MDKKKRLIINSILGVILLLGFYVIAVEHLGSYTLTTTGEADNLVNWSKQNADETFNFTIPFAATLAENVSLVSIEINAGGGYFDFATNASNSSVLMSTFGGNAYEGANYSCGAEPYTNRSIIVIVCNSTGSEAEFIQGSTLYFQVNVTANGSDTSGDTLGTDNATAIQFNITTWDTGQNANESVLYIGIDQAAPIIYDINVTDGNRTLMNGTGYSNLTWQTARDGTDNNLSDTAVTVTVLLQDPNVKNLTLIYSGNDSDLMGNNQTLQSGNRVAMSIDAVTHIGGDSGNLSDAGIVTTHVIYTGTIPASGMEAGNITTFVLVAADHYSQERVENSTAVGTNDVFAFAVSDANEMISFKGANVSDFRADSSGVNTLLDGEGLDGTSDYLRAELNTFTVELKNAHDYADTDTEIFQNRTFLYYNVTGGTVTVDANGTVTDFDKRITMENISSTNATTILFNSSINLGGNDTNTVGFVFETYDKDGYVATLGPYQYVIDGVSPAEPTLTVPSDTTIDVSSSTGITYTCASTDVTSSGLSYAWTLTKPSGSTVSATGASATFNDADINEAGTYSVKCTATDAVGYTAEHTSTETEDFSVTYTTSGTSSGGGGGGGGSSAGPSFDVDFTTSTQGTVSIAQGSTRTFTFDGSTSHTVKVDKVEGETATVTLTSVPITVTLNVGESKKVDLNEDGVNDVEVTLNGITNSIADLTITKIEEGATIVAAQEIAAAEEAAEEGPVEEGEEVTPEEVSTKVGLGVWITIIVILVVIIVGYFLMKKKK